MEIWGANHNAGNADNNSSGEYTWELVAVPKVVLEMLFGDVVKLRNLYLERSTDPRAVRERAECVIASALCLSQVAKELLGEAEQVDPIPERPPPLTVRDGWVQRTGGYDALGEADRVAASFAYKSWQKRRPNAAKRHDLAAYVEYRQSAYQAQVARKLFNNFRV